MGGQTKHFYAFGPFRLDAEKRVLVQDGIPVALAPKAAETLLVLVENAGHLVGKDELMKRVWPDAFVEEANLPKNILALRKLLGEWDGNREYIETVPKRGYRFVAPVEAVTHAEGPPPSELSTRPGVLGKKVSHYRVLEVLGGGGMGLVYKAEDLKLGRRVALKFLPEELASDAIALQRFEREARTASSLNHSNICTIHEVEEHEGQPFIVMELLEGETLRERLSACDRGLALDELLGIALQVAAGLEAAHEQGIIHRDIKPANIFLTRKGTAKILDFGLAKLMVEAPESVRVERTFRPASQPSLLSQGGIQPGAGLNPASNDKSDALNGTPEGVPLQIHGPADATLTRTGLAMGTAGYMSPEQVRGEKLDARTDLFSFGLVLYEMATGQRAFTGETAPILKDAILNRTPVPARELNSTVPAGLQHVIGKAIEKDRERRYQSAAEMRASLDQIAPQTKTKALRRHWVLWAGAAVVLALAASAIYWRLHQSIKLTDRDTVVLASFANLTGEPLFDDSLQTALAVSLQQSPFLDVLSGEKVRATFKLMNRASQQPMTREVALEVCRNTNSRALIAGSIADAGNHFRLKVDALDCGTGRVFAGSEAEAANRNGVINAVGQAATQLRPKLGEPSASIEKFNQPLEEALSSSLQAIQLFARANKSDADPANLDPLIHAVEVDPDFAVAHLSLGQRYHDLLQPKLATEYARKAYELRDRVSARQKFAIEVFYYLDANGDLEQALRTWAEYFQLYPRAPASNSTSYMLRVLGQHEKAAATAEAVLQYFPNTANPAVNLMDAHMALNRPDQAKIVFDQARERNLDTSLLRYSRYLLAFMQGDEAAMQEQVAWGKGKPAIEDMLLSYQSNTEAYWGRLKKARKLSQQATTSTGHAAFPEATAGLIANEALREAEIGNAARARALTKQALSLTQGRNTEVVAALTLARVGDSATAEKLADKLNQEAPRDTMIQGYWLPAIRATVALNRNNPEQALVALQNAFKYELGSPIEYIIHNGPMYPAYVRGQACLQAGHGPQAAAEFQKMVGHPGIMLNSILAPLAHLQLARAQVMMGDKAAARKSYQDFLNLWKDADPDIPIYQQAKAEYARLR